MSTGGQRQAFQQQSRQNALLAAKLLFAKSSARLRCRALCVQNSRKLMPAAAPRVFHAKAWRSRINIDRESLIEQHHRAPNRHHLCCARGPEITHIRGPLQRFQANACHPQIASFCIQQKPVGRPLQTDPKVGGFRSSRSRPRHETYGQRRKPESCLIHHHHPVYGFIFYPMNTSRSGLISPFLGPKYCPSQLLKSGP